VWQAAKNAGGVSHSAMDFEVDDAMDLERAEGGEEDAGEHGELPPPPPPPPPPMRDEEAGATLPLPVPLPVTLDTAEEGARKG
jgi:hypothetical protein